MTTLRRLLFLYVCVQVSLSCSLSAQVVTTTAGGYVGDGGSPTLAGLALPRFAVQDASGNTFIGDGDNHRIRKVSNGVISTFAGTGISGFSGDGGLAKNAMLSYPVGLVFDSAGNLIVADANNNRIRKIYTTGAITTIAGTGVLGFSGDGGPALAAELDFPFGLMFDAVGNLYFTDLLNNRVRKIDTNGIITTIAGNGTAGYNGDGIPATAASLNNPRGIVFDSSGNLYIADTLNSRVRRVDTSGIITTFAGDGIQGFTGDGGPAINAEVGRPRDVIIRGNQLLISNAGAARLRTVGFSSGIINSLAGSFAGFDGDNNPPLLTEFNGPTGMFLTTSGNLLVTDEFNSRVRTVTSSSTTTLAGGFVGDNRAATLADFVSPENLAFDSAGNYYVADPNAQRIRKVDTTGKITTVAGNGTTGYSGDGGVATQAQLNFPYGVVVDSAGNIFIADTGNAVIREVNTSGIITTFATDASFSDLLSLAMDSSGNLYAADDGVCVVHKITPAAVVSIVAGVDGSCGYNGDGILATAAFLSGPYGIAVDAQGNLYLGDYGNNRVRKVNRSGIISTIAGTGICGFSGDGGTGKLAMLCTPEGVAAAPTGYVYLADSSNVRIRKVKHAGKITTFAGTGIGGYNGNNLPAVSTNIGGAVTAAVDSAGNVFFVDDDSLRVRKIH